MYPGDQSQPNRPSHNYSCSYGSRPTTNRASYNSYQPRRLRSNWRGDHSAHGWRGSSGNVYPGESSRRPFARHPSRPFGPPRFHATSYYNESPSYPTHDTNFANPRWDDSLAHAQNGYGQTYFQPGRMQRPYKPRFSGGRKNTRRRPINSDAKAGDRVHPSSDSNLTLNDVDSDCNLREKLIAQLRNSSYQCPICISDIRPTDPIWSCSVCFHIYHLTCTKSWAERSKPERTNGDPMHKWRCPSCQTEYDARDDVLTYRCFCGRQTNPDYHPGRNTIPHGCDDICRKLRGQGQGDLGSDLAVTECTHPCTELCHPGPCPPCVANVILSCPCGQVRRQLICGEPNPQPCGQICQKSLDAGPDHVAQSACLVGFHTCLFPCHTGPCPPCIWVIYAACYCGNQNREFVCGSPEAKRLALSPTNMQLLKDAAHEFLASFNRTPLARTRSTCSIPNQLDDTSQLGRLSNAYSELSLKPGNDSSVLESRPRLVFVRPCFSCDKVCDRLLGCQLHRCAVPCHQGDCSPCLLDPVRCLTCPCGRVPLSKLVLSGDIRGDRTNCTDPIPTCPNVCGRPHPVCGHSCPLLCHNGPCAPCESSIVVQCRCGRTSKTLPCTKFTEMVETNGEFQLRCERICKKDKVCGRHKCTNKCCNETIHPCHEVCGRKLACKQHTCEEQCHPNPCPPCWRGVIYTELSCRCGATVLDPPQPCGSAAPKCTQPCNRTHNCDHPVKHTCHNEDTCPPCTVRLTKECIGGHGVQFQLPCFQPALSCGRHCNRLLPTCSHTCQRVCHSGSCLALPDNPNPVVCEQPCLIARPECGHPCNLPCHESKSLTCTQAATLTNRKKTKAGLDPAPCKVSVELVCTCSKRKQKLACYQVTRKIQALLQQNDKILDNLPPPTEIIKSHKGPIPLLACDESCTQPDPSESGGTTWERGLTSIGAALQLDASQALPSSGAFEPPEYSDFLKQFALNNFAFALSVERQLQNMVIDLLKSSNTKVSSTEGYVDTPRSIVHHFAPMNKKRRQFVRELAEFYGIEAYSFDPEPSRHVMVLAKRGSTKLPGGALDFGASLTNTLKRDFPKVISLTDTMAPAKSHPNVARPNLTSSSMATGLSYAQILKDKSSNS